MKGPAVACSLRDHLESIQTALDGSDPLPSRLSELQALLETALDWSDVSTEERPALKLELGGFLQRLESSPIEVAVGPCSLRLLERVADGVHSIRSHQRRSLPHRHLTGNRS